MTRFQVWNKAREYICSTHRAVLGRPLTTKTKRLLLYSASEAETIPFYVRIAARPEQNSKEAQSRHVQLLQHDFFLHVAAEHLEISPPGVIQQLSRTFLLLCSRWLRLTRRLI
jgi:hypothetical protein